MRFTPADGIECENAHASGFGDEGRRFRLRPGRLRSCYLQTRRIVLVAGPDCQLAVSRDLDTVTVAVSTKQVEKH